MRACTPMRRPAACSYGTLPRRGALLALPVVLPSIPRDGDALSTRRGSGLRASRARSNTEAVVVRPERKPTSCRQLGTATFCASALLTWRVASRGNRRVGRFARRCLCRRIGLGGRRRTQEVAVGEQGGRHGDGREEEEGAHRECQSNLRRFEAIGGVRCRWSGRTRTMISGRHERAPTTHVTVMSGCARHACCNCCSASDSSWAETHAWSARAATRSVRSRAGNHAMVKPVIITGTQQAKPSSRMADDMNRNGARTKAQATRVTSAVLLVARRRSYQDRASIPSVNLRPPSASMTESIGKGKGSQWASTSSPKYDMAAAA